MRGIIFYFNIIHESNNRRLSITKKYKNDNEKRKSSERGRERKRISGRDGRGKRFFYTLFTLRF
jgi:hypothetical protein